MTGLDEVMAEKLKVIRERSKEYANKAYANACFKALKEYKVETQRKRQKNALAMVFHDNVVSKIAFYKFMEGCRKQKALKSLYSHY